MKKISFKKFIKKEKKKPFSFSNLILNILFPETLSDVAHREWVEEFLKDMEKTDGKDFVENFIKEITISNNQYVG